MWVQVQPMSNGMYGETSGYVGVQCGAVRAIDCMYACVHCLHMCERATGAPRWEWIAIKAGPKQSCAPQTGMGRSDRRHGRSDLDAHTLATPIPALRPRPKQALPEPPRHCTSWSWLAQTLSLAGHGLPLFHETVLSRCRPSELRPGVLLACLQPSVAITLMGVASASHSCCDHEGPSPLDAAAVPRRPNLHWPKASAPTRGSWACSPTMALCRGALLRAWHMIATWTVPARFFFQNPRPKEADSLR